MANQVDIVKFREHLHGLLAGLSEGSTDQAEFVDVIAGLLKVAGPGEVPAALVLNFKRDLTTTMQTWLFPSGAKWVSLGYTLLPGATAVTNQFAKAVFNAASDADATGKLASDQAAPIFQGKERKFSAPASDPIYRVDVIAEQAVGAEKTVFAVLAGV